MNFCKEAARKCDLLFLFEFFVKPIDKLSSICYNYYTVQLYLVQFGGIYE